MGRLGLRLAPLAVQRQLTPHATHQHTKGSTMSGRLINPRNRILGALMRTIVPLLVVTLALATVLTLATMLTINSAAASATVASPDTTSTPLLDPDECYYWVGQPCTIYPNP